MVIKGLVFDFDGLILDTEIAEFQSWQETFKSYGVNLPFKEWSACIGTSNKSFDVYDYFEQQLGHPYDRNSLDKARTNRLYELITKQSILPGVEELILEAKKSGLGIALASSSPLSWVKPHLTRLGLLRHFDSIHTGDEVAEVKPDPALYNNAINALNITPDQTVAFEDSPNGIKAAKNAGIFCVAVPNQLTVMMDTSLADLQLKSLSEINLDKLNELVTSKIQQV